MERDGAGDAIGTYDSSVFKHDILKVCLLDLLSASPAMKWSGLDKDSLRAKREVWLGKCWVLIALGRISPSSLCCCSDRWVGLGGSGGGGVSDGTE